MRTVIGTLTILLLTTVISLNAQPRTGNGMHPFISQYGEELDLSEDQMKQLAELSLEYRQEFRGNRIGRNGNRGQRGDMRGNRRNNRSDGWINARSEYHTKVMEILTEDQKETLKNSMLEKAEQAHQYRMVQHEVIVDEAGLEGEKRTQVLTLMNQHSLELLNARSGDIEAMEFGRLRGAGFENRQELRNELKGLLTVEEYQKLQDVMGARRFANNPANGRRGWSRFN